MQERDLEILTNGQYKSICLRDYKEQQGLKDNEYIIVEKKFAKGLEKQLTSKKDNKPFKIYVCKVMYRGDEVSFILFSDDHENFERVGGVGDKIRISAKDVTIVNKRKQRVVKTFLTFELVA